MKIPQRHIPFLASVFAMVLLYVAGALLFKNFTSLRVFISFFQDGNAVVGILAVGMTFVILSGGIDLSVGAVMSLCSVMMGVFLSEQSWSLYPAVGVTLLIGIVIGTGMGITIHLTGIQPFIVTLAGMFFARGLGYIIQLEPGTILNEQHRQLANVSLELGGGTIPLASMLFIALSCVGIYVSTWTSFGRNVYAMGGSTEASLLMGLPLARTRVGVYAFSGFCAALGGIVQTFILSGGSHIEGVALELDVIAAVVIGGTLLTGGVGSVLGTWVGVLIIGIIYTIMSYASLSAGLNKTVLAALLLAFVLLQRVLSFRATRE